jgi:uncharacterized membrane protein YphA (DoxX/SURF4 family)
MFLVLTIITSLIFIVYGLLCFLTNHMEEEFDRYGLSKFRFLTGLLELLGGLGLLIGHFLYLPLFLFSALGLAILMLLGVIIRLKVKDPIYLSLPAFILLVFNIYFLYVKGT